MWRLIFLLFNIANFYRLKLWYPKVPQFSAKILYSNFGWVLENLWTFAEPCILQKTIVIQDGSRTMFANRSDGYCLLFCNVAKTCFMGWKFQGTLTSSYLKAVLHGLHTANLLTFFQKSFIIFLFKWCSVTVYRHKLAICDEAILKISLQC